MRHVDDLAGRTLDQTATADNGHMPDGYCTTRVVSPRDTWSTHGRFHLDRAGNPRSPAGARHELSRTRALARSERSHDQTQSDAWRFRSGAPGPDLRCSGIVAAGTARQGVKTGPSDATELGAGTG